MRIALIGCGRIAVKHLKAIRFQEKKKRGVLVAVSDLSKASAERVLGEAYGDTEAVPYYATLKELLSEEKVDILAITTPSGTHKELAIQALNSGIHVLVEKPLAMNLHDAMEIRDVARNNKRKVALGHIYRYLPTISLISDAIASGRFGRVLYGSVTVRWGHDQAYYDQSPWRGTRSADGGVILNQSVHALDLMRWLMQNEEVAIKEVNGFADLQNHEMESEDLALGSYAFNNGTYLHYEGSTSTEEDLHEAGLFICCEFADIRAGITGKKFSLSIRSEGKELRCAFIRKFLREQIKKEGLSSLKTLTNPHTAIYTDLIEAIREDREPLAAAASGVSSLEMVDKLYKATGIEITE